MLTVQLPCFFVFAVKAALELMCGSPVFVARNFGVPSRLGCGVRVATNLLPNILKTERKLDEKM